MRGSGGRAEYLVRVSSGEVEIFWVVLTSRLVLCSLILGSGGTRLCRFFELETHFLYVPLKIEISTP